MTMNSGLDPESSFHRVQVDPETGSGRRRFLASRIYFGIFFLFANAATAEPLDLKINSLNAGAVWENDAGDLLEFTDGWTLSSDNEDFGGLSALELRKGRLISVSDRGHFLELSHPEAWTKGAGKVVSWGPIPIDRSALENRGAETDAEALALTTDGDLLVAFEREHRIQVHKNLTSAPTTREVPIALRRPAPLGFGIEAMTRLLDGTIFAVSEKVKRNGGFRAYLINGDRGQRRKLMTYIPEEDWMPSAATTLPDGDVLLVERRASLKLLGFRSRLMLLRKEDLAEGARLKPQVLFTFGLGTVGADNIEGLVVERRIGRNIWLWAVTDDNFKPFQSTRLLRFNLVLAEQPEPVPADPGIPRPKMKPVQ